MSSSSTPVTENEIQAYIDGQLDAARVLAVEEYLQREPAEARRVEQFRTLNDMLRARHAAVIAEPVPATLKRPIARIPAPTHRWTWRAAAAVAWISVGGLGGWIAHSQTQQVTPIPIAAVSTPSLPTLAAVAHAVYTPEVLHPVEVTASQEAHLVTWLSKRLGGQVRAPQLAAQGYTLVGGRLLPGENAPAAQFMYESATGQRLTLYVKHNDSADNQTAFQFASERGLAVFYWVDGPFGYALAANIDKNALLSVATAVYQQLGAS